MGTLAHRLPRCFLEQVADEQLNSEIFTLETDPDIGNKPVRTSGQVVHVGPVLAGIGDVSPAIIVPCAVKRIRIGRRRVPHDTREPQRLETLQVDEAAISLN